MLLTHDSRGSSVKHSRTMSQTSAMVDGGWFHSSSSDDLTLMSHHDASLTSFSYDAIISSVVEVQGSSSALHHSSISLLSRFSAISDLTDVKQNDAVSRLRGEAKSLQSKVAKSSDEMPVNDLIKCLEQLLEVEQELEHSTRRESMNSSESSSTCSFEEEDFGFQEQLNKTGKVHPMQNLVTPQDRLQDSPPSTPRAGNKKSPVPSEVSATLPPKPPKIQDDSPRSRRSGGRKPRPTYAYVDATGQVTERRGDMLNAASDHGPKKRPTLAYTQGLSTRWSRSCSSLAKPKSDSKSASDALKFNVKLDRANSRRKRFLKMMGDEFGLSSSQLQI